MISAKRKPGQVLIFGIILLTAVTVLITGLFSRLGGFLNFNFTSSSREQATHLAEAGIDKAIQQLNENAGNYDGENSVTVGEVGSYSVVVEDKSPTVKTIKSTGFIPNAISPKFQRTITVDVAITSSTVAFNYAVQVLGDVTMDNNSRINGNVYANGNVIKGVGNGQLIDGDAYAAGSTIDVDVSPGHSKYPNSEVAPPPDVDYENWITTATAGGTVNCSATPLECDITQNTSIGPKKYDGDLKIRNNALVIIDGPIYVTGNFTIENGGTIVKLNDNFGSDGTVIIIDGKVSYTQGGTFLPTNAEPPGYLLVISTNTANDAITISQSGATAVFYALEGGAILSNTADVTALVSKSLHMSNNAELTYEQGLASASFTTGPGGSWQVTKGTYQQDDKKKYNLFNVEYFDNPDFTDKKAEEIGFYPVTMDWGHNKPHENVNTGDYSVRWTGNFFLSNKTYRLNFDTDGGGIKIKLDGNTIYDKSAQQGSLDNLLITPTAGIHEFIVEYNKTSTGAPARGRFNFVDHETCYDMTGDNGVRGSWGQGGQYWYDDMSRMNVYRTSQPNFPPMDIKDDDGLVTIYDNIELLTQAGPWPNLGPLCY